ncbi:MAG: ABC transporter ATP-binding protein [Sphingobacteriaceae bacterium]|nr:MAG: ABC transporter ATP-binding protein [Sphingobacteriaceae bacterium]
MPTAIQANNLSKAYQLGQIGTGTISRDLERWIARMRGKEDPYLKIGETNDRTSKSTSGIVWSLKDIDFSIQQGDAVGIIGRNGAGKSTLLKLLSRVTAPTTGNIKIKGRIASLLEVGTGFHPELSGRENIYLNGAILGMRKREIASKFDQIVDFAGVERYVDTPVKRYSSGMYVRLAFAVAAHLESEILIVDEVLAVGDAEFQKKCLGKMGEVSQGEGRTVLFVSHNMASVKQLCKRGIVLDKGSIGFNGPVEGAINFYKEQGIVKEDKNLMQLIKVKHAALTINHILINNSTDATLEIGIDDSRLDIEIEGYTSENLQFNIEIKVYTLEGVLVSFYSPAHMDAEILSIPAGKFTFKDNLHLPANLVNGEYYLNIELSYPNIEKYLGIDGVNMIKHGRTTASGKYLTYNEIGFFLINRNGN